MSGHGTDVTHQQAHASALQDIWNPHAALRLPKMHELPPLDTQLIPASLAKAFGIQLTHGDDDGDQAGQQREHQPQADVHQDSEQVQHQQQAQQLQQAGMQQAQTPYAAYPYGMEALDRQSFGQQYAGYPTQQGFNPMLMGSMQPGSAAYGAYMQPGMYDPRDAMAASYGLGQLPGAHAHFRCFCCYACGIGYDGAYAERIGPIMTWGLCVLMLTSTPAVPCKQVACSTPCSSSYRSSSTSSSSSRRNSRRRSSSSPRLRAGRSRPMALPLLRSPCSSSSSSNLQLLRSHPCLVEARPLQQDKKVG